MILVIGKNWENPTFYPTVDQLRLFKEKIEKGE
nr:MAG TPA: jmjN domain [Bacteriophage sp.]